MSKIEALDAAIDAFDRLYAATVGKAGADDLRQHYGATAAFEILTSKQDIDRLRAALSKASGEGV